MNKSTSLCNGEYISFMNSGDTFHSNSSISNIVPHLIPGREMIIYGDHCILNHNSDPTYSKPMNLSRLAYRSCFCHQSTIVSTSLLQRHPFSSTLKLAADYEFFSYWFFHKSPPIFSYIPMPIAVITRGGLSDSKQSSVVREWISVSSHYTFFPFQLYLLLLKVIIFSLLKRLISYF